ncbi:MAG: amino acid ABC transporter permease [Gammaproteobacteria bacterium]|nr:amino acid ABC transporter permease [Gammaproteobacteria bacterium]
MQFDTHQLMRHFPELIQALGVTVWISTLSLAFGIVLGAFACLGKLSGAGVGYRFATGFIDFFRTIPEVVLIFWVYSCLPLLLSVRISSEGCGVIALSLFGGAYLAEIFRAGVLAVPHGQVEAARALAVPTFHIWRRVIVPPAIRRMMPAFITFLTELLKASSLLSAIGVGEMAYRASVLGAKTLSYFEFLSAIAVLYFLLIFPLSMLARQTEKRLLRRTGH